MSKETVVAGIIQLDTKEIIETTTRVGHKTALRLKTRELNAGGKVNFMSFEFSTTNANIQSVKRALGGELPVELALLDSKYHLEHNELQLKILDESIATAQEATQACFNHLKNKPEQLQFVTDALETGLDELKSDRPILVNRIDFIKAKIARLTKPTSDQQ